jgi:hypothetical protein
VRRHVELAGREAAGLVVLIRLAVTPSFSCMPHWSGCGGYEVGILLVFYSPVKEFHSGNGLPSVSGPNQMMTSPTA